MDVDPYRLAYNVFHCNFRKFGIPPEDIPPPKTEKVDSLDPIIPSFSVAVLLYQIASRKDLKTFLDNECPTVHNLGDVYTRFENIMKEALPEGTKIADASDGAVKEGLPEDTMNEYVFQGKMNEDLSQNNTNEDLSQNNTNEDLSQNNTNEDISPDTVEEYLSEDSIQGDLLLDFQKESLPIDTVKEGLHEDSMKESLPGNMISPDDIPSFIAYSLAVCTELVLFERENENNKSYMKSMPDMWKDYFDRNLKPLCEEAGCTQDNLKAYSNSIKCPETFLNKFISENKKEYNDIADKFYNYTEKNFATESPEHSKYIVEVKKLPKGLSYLKMKRTFTVIKEICKCVKGPATDEIPLLTDYSDASSSSTPTSPLK